MEVRVVFRCERRAGFHIIGAWVDRQNNRFVWLIGLRRGAGEFETANNRYYDSDERALLQPNLRN